jgi:uncharacterized protein (TIGR02421 family)
VRIAPNRGSRAAATGRGVTLAEGARFSASDAKSLAAHEVGWHVLTARNGRAQPLRLLRSGTAKYLGAQEGGAVFQELLTPGALTVVRLRQLAARTLALDLALRGKSFSQIFAALKAVPHGMSDDDAYATCERIFRGGGPSGGVFAKDGVYLPGFLAVLRAFLSGTLDLKTFAAGKMALSDIPFVRREIAAGRLKAARILPLTAAATLAHVPPVLKEALGIG